MFALFKLSGLVCCEQTAPSSRQVTVHTAQICSTDSIRRQTRMDVHRYCKCSWFKVQEYKRLNWAFVFIPFSTFLYSIFACQRIIKYLGQFVLKIHNCILLLFWRPREPLAFCIRQSQIVFNETLQGIKWQIWCFLNRIIGQPAKLMLQERIWK